MKKRVLIVAIAAALLVPFGSAQAGATGEGGTTAVVAVFTGNATVSPGLCLPVGGCNGPAEADYEFLIPGDAAPLPTLCQAVGRFENLDAAGGCALIAHGNLEGLVVPGPACGNVTGAAEGENTVTFAGQQRNHDHTLLTTAGSVVPVTGNIDDADADTVAGASDHTVVALIQAIPITASGTIPCVTVPAETFIAVGIAVAA